MSVEQRVEMSGALPTKREIEAAAGERGVGLSLALGSELETQAGYLSCVVNGRSTGFEMSVAHSADGYHISFITGGDLTELAAATLTAVATADSGAGQLFNEWETGPVDLDAACNEALVLLREEA